MFTNLDAIIEYGDGLLVFNEQPCLSEFVSQRTLVHDLQKPRPKLPMNGNRTTNNVFGKLMLWAFLETSMAVVHDKEPFFSAPRRLGGPV